METRRCRRRGIDGSEQRRWKTNNKKNMRKQKTLFLQLFFYSSIFSHFYPRFLTTSILLTLWAVRAVEWTTMYKAQRKKVGRNGISLSSFLLFAPLLELVMPTTTTLLFRFVTPAVIIVHCWRSKLSSSVESSVERNEVKEWKKRDEIRGKEDEIYRIQQHKQIFSVHRDEWNPRDYREKVIHTILIIQ